MSSLGELETPCLVLERGRMLANIRVLHEQLARHGINLRPHGKTAKNIHVLRAALVGQTGSITVSTVREAEYYYDHGIEDIIYAVGIAPSKLPRLAALVSKGANVAITLDSMKQVRFTARFAADNRVELAVLIEFDCDGQRAGISPGDPRLVEIASAVHADQNLTLRGVLTHAGGSYRCRTLGEIRDLAEIERCLAIECAETLHRNDLPCPVISIGSTPTARFAERLDGVSEVRAGVFMFQDLVMAGLGVCTLDDIAISVLATVIGQQRDSGRVVTDAGWMALSRDRGTADQPLDQGYGVVCDVNGHVIPELIVAATSQEHGTLAMRDGGQPDWKRLPIGGLVRILPNHACATAAQHQHYHVVDASSEVIAVWTRVNGW